MRKSCFGTISFLLLLAAASSYAEEYAVIRRPDGPFSFKILSIVMNEGSTLQRESIMLNMHSIPVEIQGNAVKFDYKDRRFRYNMATDLAVRFEVTALEVRHLLFDVFGRHMKSLQNREVKDLPAGNYKIDGTWNILRENDVSEHLTTVTYISKARLPDGRIWKADFDQVRSVLGTLKLERTIEEEDDDN